MPELCMYLMQYTANWKGFWENLKWYYYTIPKIITWKLSVIIYSKNIVACLFSIHDIISLLVMNKYV